MRLFFRLRAALTAAKTAFIHPDIMVEQHFRVMSAMYENILKVQEENKPLMFQIGLVAPDDERHVMATVWVGAGAGSSPVKRIEELWTENDTLKKVLRGLEEQHKVTRQ